jgi:glycosyltransferase involved in cell wall biosynthesis
MGDSPRISVVIVNYNFSRYLRECIESVLAQTLQPCEIVIYDDCSTDESWNIITEYSQRLPHLIVAHRQQKNAGMQVNGNAALRRAQGELVCWLDGDDRWLPRKLELEWEVISRNPQAKIAYSNVYSINAAGQRTAIWYDGNGPEPPSGDVFVQVFSKRFFPGNRSVFRNPLLYRSVLEEMSYHDEQVAIYIDWDLKIRLTALYPVAYSGEALVEYRIHSEGIHNRPMLQHCRDLLVIYHKNLPLLANRTAAEAGMIETEMASLLKEHGGDSAELKKRVSPVDVTPMDLDASAAAHYPADVWDTARHLSQAPAGSLSTDVGQGENLVFLVSLPRSGSTLLQRILANHLDIHTVAEPWLMLHPLYALKRSGFEAEYDAGQARQALDEFLDEVPGGEENYIDALRAMASLLYGRVLQRSGKRLFLDKTPRYFHILPELKRVFPKAKFILLLRNPAAVLSSALKTWFGNDPQALKQSFNYFDMLKGPELLSAGIRILGDSAVTVQYEDLISNPNDTVSRICAHLGVPYQAAMLEYGRTPAPRGRFGDPRNVHSHNTVVNNYLEAWRDHLSTPALQDFSIDYIDSLADGVLETLGYSRNNIKCLIRCEKTTAIAVGLYSAIKEGERAFHDGDLVLAETLFKQAYDAMPDNIEVLNNLIVVYWQKGDWAASVDYLAKALELDPCNRDSVINGTKLLTALGRPEEASALCASYLANVPADDEVTGLLSDASDKDELAFEDRIGRDSQPLVTAIVSTYNSEKYIRGCLDDLEAQTLSDRLEIIVVDSGSQQNERSVVEEFQQRYGNIRYIRSEKRETIYAAWNRAIVEARGKYLTNANTDDRHRMDAFERMVAELEMCPDVSLVYADCAVTRIQNADFDKASVEGLFRWPVFDARHLFSVCYIGPQPMWRRSVHEKYGDFDAQMKVAGDYDFWLRMATSETFRHIPEVLGLYLKSPGSLEHAFADAGARESETARQRNWPDQWGPRPALSAGYLVPADQLAEGRQGKHEAAALISIVMPTKDRLQLLGRALDSVIAQTYRNWELIVVNDGGESVGSVTDGRDASDRIRRIDFDRSHGQAVARNTAFTVAKGEIICYLDDDDIYLPHHLETVVRELSGQSRAFIYTDAVVVKERLVDGAGKEVGRSNPYAHHEYSRHRLLVNNYIPINTWAHKRACLDESGIFDSSLSCYEDWEFLLRLSEHYDFHHVEQTTVEVRHRVDQVDNVSRRRLADTADAYRLIYARHGKGLTGDLLKERETVFQTLTRNIDAWTSAGEGFKTTSAEAAPGSESAYGQSIAENSYQEWLHRHRLRDRDIALISRHMMTDWTIQPSVHLLMTHLSGQEEALADTLDSLGTQLYGGWGLSVVSCSPCPDPIFEEMDILEWRQVEGDLMQEVNAVVMESTADWIGLLDAGSKLETHLLFKHVDFLHRHPEWRLVYMDEDRIGTGGARYDPLFKPEFNLELLRAMPYMGRFLLLEREALIAAGGYSLYSGTEAYDIAFRFAEQFGAEAIGHIPDVLIHQQDRFQLARDELAISEHRGQCVEAHLQRCAITADVHPGTVFGSYFIDYACKDKPPVDIIVPVSGRPESMGLFLDSLTSMTDYPDFRVRLLVRDDVELPAELAPSHCGEISTYSRAEPLWQKVLELVRESRREHILLMSPGSIAIQPNWLERLVAQFQSKDVAVAAPRLISTDKKVVGGGFILGAGPYSIGMVAYGGLSLDEPGYMGRAQVAQEMSAVSASCMLVRKSVFELLGGISEDLRIPLYQAVDYCLRVRETGRKIIWTPHSTLLYLGEDQSALDGIDIDEAVTRESEAVCTRSLATLASDPAYNQNLSLAGKRFSVDGSFSPQLRYTDNTLHRVVGLGAGSIGSWKFRIQQPLQAMQGKGVADSLILPFSKDLVQLPTTAELKRLQVDSLLMHNAMHDPYMDAMETYKRVNQTFIVFGQDDLMYAMPPKNPFSKTIYKDVKKRVRRCLSIADRVIVTTQALAEELRSMADDVRVVPNYLDEAIWGGLHSERGVSDKPRVGWAGAQQHLGDLELLEEVVRETADEVDWVFFGMCPDFLQPYVKEIHNPVTFGKYPQKLATLNLDLAVAPLEHNRFNESKSNLRLLEYGVLGWPVIASDIAPYHEGPVCRVHNQARAWIKAIRERIHDMDATRREGDALQDWVRENWLLQQHLDDWLAALDPSGDCRQRLSAQGRVAGR